MIVFNSILIVFLKNVVFHCNLIFKTVQMFFCPMGNCVELQEFSFKHAKCSDFEGVPDEFAFAKGVNSSKKFGNP